MFLRSLLWRYLLKPLLTGLYMQKIVNEWVPFFSASGKKFGAYIC